MRYFLFVLIQIFVILSVPVVPSAHAQVANQGPPNHAGFPRVSPDGKTVLFSLDTVGLYLMDIEGTNQRPAPIRAASGSSIGFALWLDNRRLITMQRSGRTDPGHLTIVNLDGSGSREIPVDGILRAAYSSGSGSTLLVASTPAGMDPQTARTASPEFREIRFDGSIVRAVTIPSLPGRLWMHKPSRDGKRLAFISTTADSGGPRPVVKSSVLYVVNSDGSNLRKVATLAGLAEQISWSHDGRKIALQHDHPFTADARGAPVNVMDLDADIIVVDIASGVTQELVHNDRKYLDETPDWTPDGRLFIQSNRDGIMEVYVMNADGSNPRRLTR